MQVYVQTLAVGSIQKLSKVHAVHGGGDKFSAALCTRCKRFQGSKSADVLFQSTVYRPWGTLIMNDISVYQSSSCLRCYVNNSRDAIGTRHGRVDSRESGQLQGARLGTIQAKSAPEQRAHALRPPLKTGCIARAFTDTQTATTNKLQAHSQQTTCLGDKLVDDGTPLSRCANVDVRGGEVHDARHVQGVVQHAALCPHAEGGRGTADCLRSEGGNLQGTASADDHIDGARSAMQVRCPSPPLLARSSRPVSSAGATCPQGPPRGITNPSG
jgi:hypothetical protein